MTGSYYLPGQMARAKPTAENVQMDTQWEEKATVHSLPAGHKTRRRSQYSTLGGPWGHLVLGPSAAGMTLSLPPC